MKIDRTTGKSFDFACPPDFGAHVLDMQMPTYETQTPAFASTIALTIKAKHTQVNVATLTGAATINLTIDASMRAGATLCLKLLSDGTGRTVTFGTGFSSAVCAGVASHTKYACFIYNGATFVPTGLPQQVD